MILESELKTEVYLSSEGMLVIKQICEMGDEYTILIGSKERWNAIRKAADQVAKNPHFGLTKNIQTE